MTSTDTTIYDTASDKHLITLFIDGEQDIDAELYYSSRYGYYICRHITQIHDGASWNTTMFGEGNEAPKWRRRSLKTYRRLDPGEVARLVCAQFVPTQEGLRDKVLDALANAGIGSAAGF